MTEIEYVDKSINPAPGCSKVSAGCKHCFAETMAKRLKAMGQPEYQNLIGEDGRWTGEVNFIEERLTLPNWRDPKRIFLNTMGDTFHENLDDRQVTQMLEMIYRNPKHTFVVVTKRPQRAKMFINYFCDFVLEGKPIPNLWLLVSVENQATADERIPHLLQTNVVVRGLSMEPLLSKVDLTKIGIKISSNLLKPDVSFDAMRGWHSGFEELRTSLDWVIVGGESGHGARPMHPDWVREIRNQAVSADVKFFFKQWGAFVPADETVSLSAKRFMFMFSDDDNVPMRKVGKKNAGRILDGRTWDEYPDVR